MKKHILIILAIFLSSSLTYAQWESCNNGLYGVPILSISATEDNAFALTGDGLFLTTNDGDTWVKIIESPSKDFNYNFFKRAINCSPNQYDVYFKKMLFSLGNSISIDSNMIAVLMGGLGSDIKLFISTDYGYNWEEQKYGGRAACCLEKVDSTIFFIFLDTYGGIYTWSGSNNIKYKLRTIYITALAHYKNTLYAGSLGEGILATYNKGESWIQLNKGLTTDSIISIAVNKNIMYAGTWNKGIFVSTDNANNWVQKNNGLKNLSVIRLAINRDMIIAGTFGGGIYISTDNGDTWEPRNNGLKDSIILSLATAGNKLWVGTRRGIFFSTNFGKSWTPKNNGLNELDIMALDTINNILLAASRTNGVFISTDYGENWIEKNNGLTDNSVYAITHKENNIFIGTPGQGVFRSTDMGETWEIKIKGLTNKKVVSLAISNSNTLFAGGGVIFRSTDFGENWIRTDKDLPRLATFCLLSTGKYIYMGNGPTLCNLFFPPMPIITSSDNGRNWFAYLAKDSFNEVHTLATDGVKIYAGTDRGLWASTGIGYDWEYNPIKTESDSIVGTINAIAISGDTIYITISSNIFISTNNGKQWFGNNNDGFPKNIQLSELKVMSGYLFAASDKGVYRVKISDLINTSDIKSPQINRNFDFYPNPTREYIDVSPYLGWEYQIYDLLGNSIQSGLIVSDKIYILSLTTGVYTIRIYKGSKQYVGKVIKE